MLNRVAWLLSVGCDASAGCVGGRGISITAVRPEAGFLAYLRSGAVPVTTSYDMLALFVPAYAPPAEKDNYVDAFCAVGLPSWDDSCQDPDADSLVTGVDNCQDVSNPGQVDADGDGAGDACDDDYDGDGALDSVDNCVGLSNPSQADLDGDGQGDACDSDVDGDGVPNSSDNCLTTPNPPQVDTDSDGDGDVCDADDDGDCVLDSADLCPTTAGCADPPVELCEGCDIQVERLTTRVLLDLYVMSRACVGPVDPQCFVDGCPGVGEPWIQEIAKLDPSVLSKLPVDVRRGQVRFVADQRDPVFEPAIHREMEAFMEGARLLDPGVEPVSGPGGGPNLLASMPPDGPGLPEPVGPGGGIPDDIRHKLCGPVRQRIAEDLKVLSRATLECLETNREGMEQCNADSNANGVGDVCESPTP